MSNIERILLHLCHAIRSPDCQWKLVFANETIILVMLIPKYPFRIGHANVNDMKNEKQTKMMNKKAPMNQWYWWYRDEGGKITTQTITFIVHSTINGVFFRVCVCVEWMPFFSAWWMIIQYWISFARLEWNGNDTIDPYIYFVWICSVEHESTNFLQWNLYHFGGCCTFRCAWLYYTINHQRWNNIDAHAHGISRDETDNMRWFWFSYYVSMVKPSTKHTVNLSANPIIFTNVITSSPEIAFWFI